MGTEIGRQAIQHSLESIELSQSLGARRGCAEAKIVGQLKLECELLR
jgi:hypothetical protein